MKKIFVFLIFTFLLTACSSANDEQAVFELSDVKKQSYNEQVSEVLKNYYWNYDETENTFVSIAVPTNDFDAINAASMDIGYDLSPYKAFEVIAAVVKLRHLNNEYAGTACFYFVSDKIAGAYYSTESNIYSLRDKNVFLNGSPFEVYENLDTVAEFDEKKLSISMFTDYSDTSENGHVAVIDDENKLTIYRYKGNKFNLYRTVSFENEDFFPMDFKYTSSGAVVLLGKKDELLEQEAHESVEYQDEHYSDSGQLSIPLKSWKVVFLDKNYKKLSEEISLDLSIYNTINIVDDAIYISRGNSIDVFKKQNGVWDKVSQIMLKHYIMQMKTADIDGDGSIEAVINDGMDLYVYSCGDTFERLWKTNFSIKTIQNNIYISDLNNDGIKEIYIEDTSQTSIKYILSENGFKTSTKGIGYGCKLLPADYNSDGKQDYLLVSSDSLALYLAKG